MDETNVPDGFVQNMFSLDDLQPIAGGYSSRTAGYWISVPAGSDIMNPHTAYLLHRALGQYLAHLEKIGETPKFMVETVGLPENPTCFGIR